MGIGEIAESSNVRTPGFEPGQRGFESYLCNYAPKVKKAVTLAL
jgi:hypothetical protein